MRLVALSTLLVALAAPARVVVAAPAKGAPGARRGSAPFLAELVAQSFFRGLLEGRLEAIEPLCAKRVRVEGRWVERPQLKALLQRLIRRARRRGLKLRKLVLLDYKEMVRRHGPPPKRLRPALRAGDLLALARFGQLGAVIALRPEGRFYRIHLITD